MFIEKLPFFKKYCKFENKNGIAKVVNENKMMYDEEIQRNEEERVGILRIQSIKKVNDSKGTKALNAKK